jgi:hypothetical protein
MLAGQGPLRVLDGMAGCGIRALRYGLEAGASEVWANDADPNRLPLLEANLQPLVGARVRTTALTAQALLAGCLQRQERFELVDLDAFGCPTSLVPLALEAVSFGVPSAGNSSASEHSSWSCRSFTRASCRLLGAEPSSTSTSRYCASTSSLPCSAMALPSTAASSP